MATRKTRVLFLNRWRQFDGNERWDNTLARPELLMPTAQYDVTYICDSAGKSGVPAAATDVHVVRDLNALGEVRALTRALIAAGGPFAHLIALSENLLDVAASLRDEFDIPGQRVGELARFRDKVVMKERLANAGIAVPSFRPCNDATQARQAARELGVPVILKPRRGTASQGVQLLSTLSAVDALSDDANLRDYEVESFISGELLHADGVVDASGACLFRAISRYTSDCLAFTQGTPLGSVLLTDLASHERYLPFVERALSALELRASAFHIELFDTGSELVFLEIGARVPGADVAYVIHDVFGVNLFELWLDVTLGRAVHAAAPSSVQSGGWLMIPRPQPLPRRVVSATRLQGKIPFLYRELVPKPGDVLEQSSGYATLQGGRFLFRGGNSEQITAAIRAAQAAYELVTSPH